MTTASEMPHDVAAIIETLLRLLCSGSIYREIERPIDKATEEFNLASESAASQAVFNQVITDFVQHIYGTAIRFTKALPDHEALAEAIHLLNQHGDAEGPDRYGSTVSIVSAGGPEELRRVLFQLSEIVKDIERQKFIRWIFTCHFRNLEWKRQLHIVGSYKESMVPNLPAELQRLAPEQLAEHFEDLLRADVMVRNIFNQRLNHEEQPSWKTTTTRFLNCLKVP